MSKHSTKNDDTQELDLSAVSRGIGNIFRNFNTFLYRCIRFVIRNIILIGILVIIGGVLGTWMDNTQSKVYNHQIIVSPNFGSTDYLYSKIDLIDSKIKERDTVFLNKIGIKHADNIAEIKISPIIDIFKFVNTGGSDQNYKLLDLMAQDGDIKKILSESTTSKNYPFHIITFTTRGLTTKDASVTPLLNYLNDNEYFKKIQKQYLENVQNKIKANDIIIAQIDAVLNDFANNAPGGTSGNEKQVYINQNSQLNDVIKTKDELTKEIGNQRIDLVGLDKIIKDNSIITNIMDKGSFNGKMKLVLPMLLVFFFLCIHFFRAFYRKQTIKYNTK
jgi:hypothetical protein